MSKTPHEKPADGKEAKRPLAKLAGGAARLGPTLLLLGNVVIAGLIVWLVFFYGRGRIDAERTLAAALAALDDNDNHRARGLAEALLAPDVAGPRMQGGALFVLGAVVSREADESFEPERQQLFALAARHLQDARKQGFPAGRKSQGLRWLGQCQLALGQYPESRLALEAALDDAASERAAVLAPLVEALLGDDPPDLDAALSRNAELLAEGGLDPKERQKALLQRARIALARGETAEIAAMLAEIPPKSAFAPEARWIEAASLLAQARTERAKAAEAPLAEATAARYRAAIELYRKALTGPTLSREAARGAHLAIGECYYELGDTQAALAQFVRTRRLHPQTPEGVTASLREAELTLAAGNHADALAALKLAVQAAGDPTQFHNPTITLDAFRAQLLTAYDQLSSAGLYGQAVGLALAMEPIVAHDRAIELAAQANRAWGQALMQQAEALPSAEAEERRAQAREHLRAAGLALEELAELRTTERTYVDHLWASAESLLASRDYAAARRLLERYLREESRRRRPLALVSLGETLLAENQPQDALALFADCLENFPRDAMAYQARLLASATYFELGDLPKAEEQLMALLNDEQLTPSSREWREALFSLGRLLYLEGRYEDSFARLDEAVARYPELPATVEARFLSAEAYRLRARQLRDALNDQTPETQRQEDTRRAQELFEASLTRHAALQDRLLELLELQQLSAQERALLRNSYFSRGAVLMALGRWDEAIRIYTTLTNRYPRDPEVLDAYLQIARCYRRLDLPLEARASLEQAKVALSRIEEGAPFENTTNFSRAEWSEMLAWMSAL